MTRPKSRASRKKHIRVDRNSAEAAVEENSKPYDEIGKTNEEIQREQGTPQQEPGPHPGSVPSDGS